MINSVGRSFVRTRVSIKKCKANSPDDQFGCLLAGLCILRLRKELNN